MKCYPLLLVALAVLLLAALVSACGGGPPSTEPSYEAAASPTHLDATHEGAPAPTVESQRQEETKTSTPAPEATQAKLPPEAEQVVQLAREDLTRRLDLAPEEIQVVSVEAVDWPDTSLGCPQPGMMYAQVITPGFRVVLEAEGQTYEYHTDRSRAVVLCESIGGSDEATSKGIDAAVQDGWPNQPVEPGEIDRSRVTPIVPPQ